MNYKFERKPVIIEAFQMTKERRRDNSEWPNWLNRAWQMEPDEEGCFYSDPGPSDNLFIATLEGIFEVTFDDFIIQGVSGELYPCKPDIFKQIYKEVTDE